MTTQTTKRPRKDEIASVIKLVHTQIIQLRNFAVGHREQADKHERLDSAAYLRKMADQKERTAARYEKVESWLKTL